MNMNVNVKRKFLINGKKYDSLEDRPAEYREAIQKVLAAAEGGGLRPSPAAARTKIVFNGTEYDGLEAMPQDVRQLYEKFIKAAEIDAGPDGLDLRTIFQGTGVESRAKGPILSDFRPEKATTGRPFFLRVLMGLVLLLGLFFLIKILF